MHRRKSRSVTWRIRTGSLGTRVLAPLDTGAKSRGTCSQQGLAKVRFFWEIYCVCLCSCSEFASAYTQMHVCMRMYSFVYVYFCVCVFVSRMYGYCWLWRCGNLHHGFKPAVLQVFTWVQSPKRRQRRMCYACRPSGTVIRGETHHEK